MRSFQPGLFHVVVSTFQNPSPDPKSPARTKLSVVLHKHVQVPGVQNRHGGGAIEDNKRDSKS